jgi:hypothetical protein
VVQVREEGDDEREMLEEARQSKVEAEGQLGQVGRVEERVESTG